MSVKRESEIPLLFGRPSDRSITDPRNWIKHLRKVGRLEVSGLPEYCVLSFAYMSVKECLLNSFKVKEIRASSEQTPWYSFEYDGMPVCFAQIGTGAPIAAATLEEVFALGVKYAIFFGGAGVLDSGLARWTILVPSKAIRDEGTSYHYEEPSTYSLPSQSLLSSVCEALRRRGERFVEGAVWTTDAVYRETSEKRDRFIKKSAICVDMEASALFSVAKYRGRHISGLFYAGDLVGQDEWDLRIQKDHKARSGETTRKLLDISLEALHNVWAEESNAERR